jgi:hypothetical protein
MTADSLEAKLSAAPAADRAGSPWIESPAFDLAFFVLAPLSGILMGLLAPAGRSLFVLFIGSALGIPHYVSTFSFYFWDENRAYRRAHWLEFVALPLGLVAAFTIVLAMGEHAAPLFIIFWWNAFHIARQNCGILSIYRHGAGVRDAREKSKANAVILSVSALFALWNVDLNPTVAPMLRRLSPELPRMLLIAAAAISLIAVARLLAAFAVRRPSLPEAGFMLGSIAMFTPYLFVRDWNRAGFCVLTGHFVQYLALVWLLHRRRFRSVEGSFGQRMLARISGDVRLLAIAMLGVSAAFFLAQKVSARIPWKDTYAWVSGVLILLHFYLDGLFWAFKRPEVRKSLGPYLISARPA